ncbi:MAG: hypothetical protein II721_02610, partial [Bacilli bacterium]|nr:hypothetical protein [Bacilli bacterium]
EKNIFISSSNIVLDKNLGYKEGGVSHSYLDSYEESKENAFAKIEEEGIEDKAISKAEREHLPLVFDYSFNYRRK